jgi:hypothetical protein
MLAGVGAGRIVKAGAKMLFKKTPAGKAFAAGGIARAAVTAARTGKTLRWGEVARALLK